MSISSAAERSKEMALKTSVSGNVYRVSNKQMTARKEHRCAHCARKISIGDRYTRRNYIFYNGADTEYFNGCLCSKCENVEHFGSGKPTTGGKE